MELPEAPSGRHSNLKPAKSGASPPIFISPVRCGSMLDYRLEHSDEKRSRDRYIGSSYYASMILEEAVLGACGRSPERADRFETTPCQADRRPFRRSEMADLACGRAS